MEGPLGGGEVGAALNDGKEPALLTFPDVCTRQDRRACVCAKKSVSLERGVEETVREEIREGREADNEGPNRLGGGLGLS